MSEDRKLNLKVHRVLMEYNLLQILKLRDSFEPQFDERLSIRHLQIELGLYLTRKQLWELDNIPATRGDKNGDDRCE